MLLMTEQLVNENLSVKPANRRFVAIGRLMFCVAAVQARVVVRFQDNIVKFILKPISGIGVAPLINALTVLLVAPSPVTFRYQQKT
ncbi:hypothetical protein [Rhizobium sp. Nf11,1]|uniref:hypothetical protein n=1 Tax=Rhizobium sp. Nf11,1 TaxID=3404923 RepID=UPI003D3509A0